MNRLSVRFTFSTIILLGTSRSIGAKFQIPFMPALTSLSATSWAPFFGIHTIAISTLFSLTNYSTLSESIISKSLIFRPIIFGFASNTAIVSNPASLKPV